MSDSLGEVFAEARRYGLVDIATLDGGTYSCTILLDFGHLEMKAKSGFDHLTPQAAVVAAIRVADDILRAAASPHIRPAAKPPRQPPSVPSLGEMPPSCWQQSA
jgi:hypothetical protein